MKYIPSPLRLSAFFAAIFMLSCSNDISDLLDNFKDQNSSSSVDSSSAVAQSSSSRELSSSSEEISSSSFEQSSSSGELSCEEKEYNSETHFCDSRDSKVYKFVEIGGQTWMAQNLNFKSQRGSVCHVPCPMCDLMYDCETYKDLGAYRLYDGYTVAASQNVCPAGWHLPSDEEWTALTDFVGSDAGRKLKAKDANGTDDYGFNAQSYIFENNDYTNDADIGRWWSSVRLCPALCLQPLLSHYIRQMSYESSDVLRDSSYVNSEIFYAIRCVKNLPKEPRY